jgi:hypothetical protein
MLLIGVNRVLAQSLVRLYVSLFSQNLCWIKHTRLVCDWLLAQDHCLDTDKNLQQCRLARYPAWPRPGAQQGETNFPLGIEVWIQTVLTTLGSHALDRRWSLIVAATEQDVEEIASVLIGRLVRANDKRLKSSCQL